MGWHAVKIHQSINKFQPNKAIKMLALSYVHDLYTSMHGN